MGDAKSQVMQTVERFLKAALEKGVCIDRAFLFGSHARGEPRDDRDIDIAIISKDFSGNRILDAQPLDKLIWRIDVRIEPIALRPEDSNDNDPLAYQIIKHGIEIPVPKRN